MGGAESVGKDSQAASRHRTAERFELLASLMASILRSRLRLPYVNFAATNSGQRDGHVTVIDADETVSRSI